MSVRDEVAGFLVTAGYAPSGRAARSNTSEAFSAEVPRVGHVAFLMQYVGDAVLGSATVNLSKDLDFAVARTAAAALAESSSSLWVPYAFEKIPSLALAWSTESDEAAVEAVRRVVGLIATLHDGNSGASND